MPDYNVAACRCQENPDIGAFLAFCRISLFGMAAGLPHPPRYRKSMSISRSELLETVRDIGRIRRHREKLRDLKAVGLGVDEQLGDCTATRNAP